MSVLFDFYLSLHAILYGFLSPVLPVAMMQNGNGMMEDGMMPWMMLFCIVGLIIGMLIIILLILLIIYLLKKIRQGTVSPVS